MIRLTATSRLSFGIEGKTHFAYRSKGPQFYGRYMIIR